MVDSFLAKGGGKKFLTNEFHDSAAVATQLYTASAEESELQRGNRE